MMRKTWHEILGSYINCCDAGTKELYKMYINENYDRIKCLQNPIENETFLCFVALGIYNIILTVINNKI